MSPSEIPVVEVLQSLGYSDVTELAPITGGWDTAIWRFATGDGNRHGLRIYRTADRQPSAMRELAALEAAGAAGLPAPAVEAHGSWQDRPAVILSWRPGEPLVQYLARKPWLLWHISKQFGQMQARIHTAPVPQALREGAPSYWLARSGGGAEMDMSYLESARLRTDTFVHMDFHPLNVLTDGRSITGVVDWTNAAAGDARADLAWTTTLLRVGPMPPHPLNPILRRIRGLFYRGWRRGYESKTGPIPDLAPFLLWAGKVLLNEVLPRIDDPQVWASAKDFQPLHQWIEHWERRVRVARSR